MANRKLGQHFLVDKRYIEKIVQTTDIQPKDMVLEIGPGKGAITEEILKYHPKKYIGIEKDKELVKYLNEKITLTRTTVNNLEYQLKNNKHLIIKEDILKVLPKITYYSLPTTRYKLIGNIPFYLTGYLLRTLGELKHKPILSVLLVQKEIAERIVAKPPKMNILAASTQYWANINFLEAVLKNSFNPPPKVDGGIITLEPKNNKLLQNDKNYYKTIRLVFKHPRKTVLNNIKKGKDSLSLNKEETLSLLKNIDINPSDRPENLSIDDLIGLSNALFGKSL